MGSVTLKARFIFLFGLVVVLFGCRSSEPLEETMSRIIRSIRMGLVSVTNIDGSIQIYGAHQEGVHLQAIKKAYSPARLKVIAVSIDARPNSIVIDTAIPQSRKLGLFRSLRHSRLHSGCSGNVHHFTCGVKERGNPDYRHGHRKRQRFAREWPNFRSKLLWRRPGEFRHRCRLADVRTTLVELAKIFCPAHGF